MAGLLLCFCIDRPFAPQYQHTNSLNLSPHISLKRDIHCLQEAIMTPEGGARGYPYNFIKITHPVQERLATPPGSTSLTLLQQWRGFFYIPQEPDNWKYCKDGTYSFSSLSDKTRKSNRLRMSLQRQHFEDPECWSSMWTVDVFPKSRKNRMLSRRLVLVQRAFEPAKQTGTLPTELTRRQL